MLKYILLICLLNSSFQSIVNIQPLSMGRAYFAGVSMPLNGIAMFGGGRNSINVVDTIDIYNVNTNTWTTNKLSIPRQLLTATNLLNSYVFFAGGCNFGCNIHYDRVDVFNINTNRWTISNLTVGRSSITSASLYRSGLAFFAGGANQNGPSNVIDITDGINWVTNTLSVARFSIASTSISDIVFFAGGNDLMQVYATIDYYDSQAGQWGVLNLTYARTQCGATSLPELGLLFIAGGKNNLNQDMSSIEIFDLVNTKWYNYQLSSPRRDLVALSIPLSNTVYFAGGVQYYDGFIPRYSPVVDYLNFNNSTQDSFNMPIGKAYMAATTLPLQNLVFIAGGETGPNLFYINEVNVYGGCNFGLYQTINPSQCLECDAGNYCHFGETIPQSCPPGYYCLKGQTQLIPCPTGTYGPNKGSKDIGNCLKCPAGTYNSLSGQNSLYSCLPCYPGSYCNAGTSFPRDCPNNNYCPDPSQMLFCPPGTFRISEFSQSINNCQPCPPGSYCPGNGAYATPCISGTYSTNNGSINCEICPSGHFCQFGAVNAQICPKDTMAQKGSSACTPCEVGQYTEGPGYSSCMVCLNSYWSVDNWWCQDRYQRLITVIIWIGTIISTIITFVKIRLFFRKRIKKLRFAGVPVTLKNIFFIDRHINRQKSYLTSLISKIEEAHSETLYRNTSEEIRGLRETIINLKMEIDDLK